MIQNRSHHFLSGLPFVLLGLAFKLYYRPFANTNQFTDLGLADSAPSFFYVTGFSLMLSINPRFNAIYTIVVVTLGSILFEVYQSFGGNTFDFSDGIYSIIGGLLSLLIHYRLKKKEVSTKV